MLRAHGLIRKRSRSYGYDVSRKGPPILNTLLAAHHLTVRQINRIRIDHRKFSLRYEKNLIECNTKSRQMAGHIVETPAGRLNAGVARLGDVAR